MADARARCEKGFYATLNQLSTSDILPSCPKRKKANKGSFYEVERLIASRRSEGKVSAFIDILYCNNYYQNTVP